MTKKKVNYVTCVIIILIAAYSGNSFAETSWKPYVCKVMDFFECKNGRKLIFPIADRYSDKETCYEEFEKLWETDVELDRKYPKTDDPNENYIFGCVKD